MLVFLSDEITNTVSCNVHTLTDGIRREEGEGVVASYAMIFHIILRFPFHFTAETV